MLTLRRERAFGGLAIAAAAALHLALVWVLFQQRLAVVRAPPPPHVVMVLPPAVVPKPKPVAVAVAVVKKSVVPKPVVVRPPVAVAHVVVAHAVRRVTQHSARPAAPPPVRHFNAAPPLAGLGLGLDIGTPAGGDGQPGAIVGFDDSVKARIAAAKTYPPGIKGFWNECVVSYRVTVDRGGQLVDYKIYGCGNPFLDAAATAAILNASPYPAPPDFGGRQYDVFGSLIYKQGGTPP